MSISEEAEFFLITLRTDRCTFLWAAWGEVQLRAVCNIEQAGWYLKLFSWLVRHEKTRHTCMLVNTRLVLNKRRWSYYQYLKTLHETLSFTFMHPYVFPIAHLTFHDFSSFYLIRVPLMATLVYSIQKYLPSPYCVSDIVQGTVDTIWIRNIWLQFS